MTASPQEARVIAAARALAEYDHQDFQLGVQDLQLGDGFYDVTFADLYETLCGEIDDLDREVAP